MEFTLPLPTRSLSPLTFRIRRNSDKASLAPRSLSRLQESLPLILLRSASTLISKSVESRKASLKKGYRCGGEILPRKLSRGVMYEVCGPNMGCEHSVLRYRSNSSGSCDQHFATRCLTSRTFQVIIFPAVGCASRYCIVRSRISAILAHFSACVTNRAKEAAVSPT